MVTVRTDITINIAPAALHAAIFNDLNGSAAVDHGGTVAVQRAESSVEDQSIGAPHGMDDGDGVAR